MKTGSDKREFRVALSSRINRTLLGILAAAGMISSAHAQSDLYWSGNGTTQGGAGTWNVADQRWGTVAGGPYTTIWDNGNNDTAIFGGAAGGAVGLGEAITVGGMQFDTAGYSLTGAAGALTFGVDGNIVVNANAGIPSTLLAVAIDKTVTKTGAGILTFTGSDNNTYAGVFKISEGTVRLSPDYTAGDRKFFGSINLNGGSLHGYMGYSLRQRTTLVTVTANSIVSAGESGSASSQDRSLSLGALSIGGNTLTLTKHSGSSTTTVSFNGTSLTGDAVFDVLNGSYSPPTKGSLGNLSDNGSGRTITKNGPGPLTWGTITLSGDHIWNVNEGTLTSGAVSGDFSLTKGGAGTLVLNAAGSYSGGTIINAGTLTIGNNAALGATSGSLTIATTGATLNLNGKTATVDKLFIGSKFMAAGVYGVGNIEIPQITGAGTLTVSSGPPPGSVLIIR